VAGVGAVNAPANLTDAAFRVSVVGASEVAALFGQSPWLTHFELWHRKAGNVATPDFNAVEHGQPENERVYWGVKLEPVVIEAACERWGYRPLETPARIDNGKGLGGHPDKIVMCPQRGRGILEVKTADWLVAKGWGDEPPLHYLLQSQAYQGLAGCDWGDVIVLVGGNELRRFQYQFRPVIYADIEARVVEFWRSIDAGKPPKPDYTRDGTTLVEVIGAPVDAVVDLTRHNRAGILAADFLEAKARKAAAEGDMETAKAELIEIVGGASIAKLEGYRIGCGMTAATPGKLVTEEMVGTHIGARKGWRRFDVKEIA
jgi:predicted phage-related endonuclease